MDLSKLSVQFIQGYSLQNPLPDGYVQKDKLLPYFSVVYPLQGYYELIPEGGDPVTVPEGGCFLMPPGVRHTLVHRARTGFLLDRWLFFSVMYQDVLDVTSWFRSAVVLTGQDAQPFKAAVDTMVDLPKDPHLSAFRQLRVAGSLLEALWAVSEFSPTEHMLDRITPALELVRDRGCGKLTVEDMARVCGMSVSAFHRAFRDTVCRTPMQYLSDHRLKKAAGLLLREEMTLSEIAACCGFCDEFHLSHNFKRNYGTSPRDYRRNALR